MIRNAFEIARKNSPCIIFIDEIDSLGSKRNPNESSFSRQTLNQILAEMDGFEKNKKIIVVGATNLENSIDSALKRPGRFDRVIRLSAPSRKARKKLFDLYLSKVQINPEINLDSILNRSIGFTGADIKNLVNLAAIRAVKND